MNKSNDLYSGWERYYCDDNSDTSVWKDDIDSFLIENMSILLNNLTHPKVLDVACGDGRNTMAFYNSNAILTCVDISNSALNKLRSKISDSVLICEDFGKSHLIEQQFDVVLCFDGLAQMDNTVEVIIKLCSMAKKGGYIVFNFFTSGDCAYGEGEKIDDYSFLYKNTLFKFYNEDEITQMLPDFVSIEKVEFRRWQDPPHGDFRPYEHTHEAVYYLLKRVK